MGGRGSASGMSSGSSESSGLGKFGMSQVDYIDEDRFTGYARELAEEANEYADDNLTVSYKKGNDIAYASIDTDSDSLEGIMSTGGHAGTELLGKIMEYQQSRGKGLFWMADKASAIRYYNSLGLGKYASGNSKTKVYEISPSQMADAIKRIK